MPKNKALTKHLIYGLFFSIGLAMVNFTQKAFSEITNDQIIQDYYEAQIRELNLNNRYYQTAKYYLIVQDPRLVISDIRAQNQDLNIEDNNNFTNNDATNPESGSAQAQDANIQSDSQLQASQLQFANGGVDLYPDAKQLTSQKSTAPISSSFVSVSDVESTTGINGGGVISQPSSAASFGGLPNLNGISISSSVGGTDGGTNSSGTGGGTSGGTSGGTGGVTGGGTAEELCRSLTKTQTKSRLVSVDAELTTKQQDVNLIYEKGMLLFCLGEYKKSGLELAKIYVIDPQNKLLNDGDNELVTNQFTKSLAAYKANPDSIDINEQGQGIIGALEEKNANIDLYVGELSKDYQYSGNGKTNFIQEASESFKYYGGSDAQLKQDLSEIYGSDAAEDIIKSRTDINAI